MSAAPDLKRKPDLAVLGTTTVGYYLVHDLLKTPRKRRLAGLAVLAAGGGAALSAVRTRTRVPAQTQATPDSAGHGHAPTQGTSPRRYLVPAATGAATLLFGSWVNAKIDRAATGVITRTLGKLPLVGGLFRRLPYTAWGLAQVGMVAGAARMSERSAAIASDDAAKTGAKAPVTSTVKDAK